MLGSHNSFTYLSILDWYLKPFSFMAKCQSKSIKDQYEKYGVRLFDLRLRFDHETGDPIICHGLIRYNSSNLKELLEYLNSKGDCYCRVILETLRTNMYTYHNELLFSLYCADLIHYYPNIRFFGGNRKFDWKVVHEFPEININLIDKYSSTTTLFRSNSKFLRIIDDLYPRLYAKLKNFVNKLLYEEYFNQEEDCLFIDFIEYG